MHDIPAPPQISSFNMQVLRGECPPPNPGQTNERSELMLTIEDLESSSKNVENIGNTTTTDNLDTNLTSISIETLFINKQAKKNQSQRDNFLESQSLSPVQSKQQKEPLTFSRPMLNTSGASRLLNDNF